GGQHGRGGQAGGDRVRGAADADDPGGGDRPVGVPRLRGRAAAVGPLPRRRVQPQADPFGARLPDPGGVRAAVAHATGGAARRTIRAGLRWSSFWGALQTSIHHSLGGGRAVANITRGSLTVWPTRLQQHSSPMNRTGRAWGSAKP